MIFYTYLYVFIAGALAGPSPTLLDAIPVMSQAKYLFLYAIGEPEQAAKTWNNFKNMTHLWENVKHMDESVPIVGHVESAVYLISGDPERAKEIIAKANKSTLILGCFILSGPAGALGGSVIADSANSLFLQKPMGIVDHVVHFEEKNASDHVDAILELVVSTTALKAPIKMTQYTKGNVKTTVRLELKPVDSLKLYQKKN